MNRFFSGRYGLDAYSIFLILFSLIFLQTRYLWPIGLALAGYALFRAFSRDRTKRYIELQKFNADFQRFMAAANRILVIIKTPFARTLRRFRERKEFVYFKCPKCRKFLRLPRNKGKIEITCPVCRERFIRKT